MIDTRQKEGLVGGTNLAFALEGMPSGNIYGMSRAGEERAGRDSRLFNKCGVWPGARGLIHVRGSDLPKRGTASVAKSLSNVWDDRGPDPCQNGLWGTNYRWLVRTTGRKGGGKYLERCDGCSPLLNSYDDVPCARRAFLRVYFLAPWALFIRWGLEMRPAPYLWRDMKRTEPT